MRLIAKSGIVVGGYYAAFAVAWLALKSYIAVSSGIDRQTYSGMSAFGDGLVFLAVLGLASVPATGAALYFLRPHRAFWRCLCVAVVVLNISSIASLMAYVVPASSHSIMGQWSDIAP